METRNFVILCVFLSLSGLAGAVSIKDCESPKSYVPGVFNHNFHCYFSGNATSNISWTIAKDDGTTLNLGTCNPVCNKSYSSAALQFKGKGAEYVNSTLRYFFLLLLNGTGSEFDGILTCTETFANGTVESASCRQKAVRIRAYEKEIVIKENYNSTDVWCDDQRQPGSTVTWTLVTESGHTIDLGTCSGSVNCTSLHPNVTLSRRGHKHGYNKALFTYWQRDMGGQLICSYIKDEVVETDNITLTVYNPATLDNCSVEISQRNWTAILSCEVTRVFVSSGDYKYRLKTNGIQPEIYIFEDPKSYRDALTPYTNSTNNKTYYRGRLVISWPLSDVSSHNSNFTLELGDGISNFNSKRINGFRVSPPSKLTHNCSYLNHIPGSRAEPCFCSADSLGSPPGRLLWLLGDTAMATGDYNVSHLQLPSDMGDRCDGLTVACQLDWINATTLIVTKHESSLTTKECELVESEKTGAIRSASMADINEETLPEIVNTTKAVLRENTTTSALDVILVASILENAIRLSDIAIETATDILEIVEIVAGLNQTVLEQSNTADNATNRVLQAVESLGDRVSLDESGSTRIETNNTVLQVWNLTTISDLHVLGLELALDSGNVSEVTDGQGRGNQSEDERRYDNTDTAIMLPGKIGRSIVEKYPGQDIRISGSIFTKTSLFRSSASNVTDADSRYRHATLNSKVIALRITVDGQPKTNLTAFGEGSVTTVFTPVQSLSKEQSLQRELSTCVFWDFAMQDGKGAWSEEGCNYSDTVQGKVVCECDHLTNFAVLLDLYGQESRKEKIAQIHESALSLISKIGLSLSIAGLSVTVISFIVIKKLHSSNSQQTLFNMALALLLAWVTFLAGFSRRHGHASCVLVAALLHYLILVSFMWMVIEGILLFLQFKARLGKFSRYMLKTALPAWGLPLIPVIITLSIDVNLYSGGEQYCWMSRTPFYYAFLAPIAIMVCANIVLYILIVVSICRRRDMSHGGTSYTVISIRASIASFVVLGLSWVFAFFAIEDARLVFQYLFTLTTACQGILIFAIFTARDAAVRQFWLDLICKKIRKGLPWSRLITKSASYAPATKETSFSRSS